MDAVSVVGLSLDGEKRWQVDEHTRSIFAKMTATVTGSALSLPDEESRRAAGAALQADINDLVQGCSMTGASHDQLHTYLGVYIPAVASLAESGQAADASKVEGYLATYAEIFE